MFFSLHMARPSLQGLNLQTKGMRRMAEAAPQDPFCLVHALLGCSPTGAAANEEGRWPLPHSAWGSKCGDAGVCCVGVTKEVGVISSTKLEALHFGVPSHPPHTWEGNGRCQYASLH